MATKKKAAPVRRMTAKVSPLRGMPVNEWVKTKTTGWQKAMVVKLLGLARRAAPGATVSIKWGQPVLEHNGPFAFIKPAKAHVTFGFWRGGELGDAAGVLEGSGARMRHLKITSPDGLNEEGLVTLVREAVALNRAKGNPSKR